MAYLFSFLMVSLKKQSSWISFTTQCFICSKKPLPTPKLQRFPSWAASWVSRVSVTLSGFHTQIYRETKMEVINQNSLHPVGWWSTDPAPERPLGLQVGWGNTRQPERQFGLPRFYGKRSLRPAAKCLPHPDICHTRTPRVCFRAHNPPSLLSKEMLRCLFIYLLFLSFLPFSRKYEGSVLRKNIHEVDII